MIKICCKLPRSKNVLTSTPALCTLQHVGHAEAKSQRQSVKQEMTIRENLMRVWGNGLNICRGFSSTACKKLLLPVTDTPSSASGGLRKSCTSPLSISGTRHSSCRLSVLPDWGDKTHTKAQCWISRREAARLLLLWGGWKTWKVTSVFIEVSKKEENLSHNGKKTSRGRSLRVRGFFLVNKSEGWTQKLAPRLKQKQNKKKQLHPGTSFKMLVLILFHVRESCGVCGFSQEITF